MKFTPVLDLRLTEPPSPTGGLGELVTDKGLDYEMVEEEVLPDKTPMEDKKNKPMPKWAQDWAAEMENDMKEDNQASSSKVPWRLQVKPVTKDTKKADTMPEKNITPWLAQQIRSGDPSYGRRRVGPG